MRQYEQYEMSWRAGEPGENQVNVDLKAVFEKEGKTISVDGFYAGNGIYKIRFLPQETGEYTCTVTGHLPGAGRDGERCAGISGTHRLTAEPAIEISGTHRLTAEPAAEDRHGPVRAEGTGFVHADGSRFLPFGTTVYAMIHQGSELLEETFETLGRSPFNKIRFCVFPKHYDFNRNEPEVFPFERDGEGWNTRKPCMQYWELLDSVLERLEQMGIQADLILFHPYDKWGFAKLSREQRLEYLEYARRRLGAHPNLWWSLANEYDLLDHIPMEEWLEMSAFLAQPGGGRHLLSNHNFVSPWDFSDPNTTHVCLQESDATKIPGLLRSYGKPVIYDEMGYEGNIPYHWGNLSPFEMVNRFWKTVTLGGFATHGETYMERMDHSEALWWSKGGTLKGKSAERIAFLKKLLYEMPGPVTLLEKESTKWENQDQLRALIEAGTPGLSDSAMFRCMAKMTDEEFVHMQRLFQQPVIHCGEACYLAYYGDMCTILGTLELPENRRYRVEVIDAWEMTRTAALEGVHGTVEVTLPGKPGMAVLAVAM